jgi:hypothetical protein
MRFPLPYIIGNMSSTPVRCALCLQEKPLLDSHFIPAAIYKNLIDPAGTIKNMIATNLSVASEESKQIKQPLLCQDCEILFRQGGESWVLGRRLMPNGTFLLRDLLRQTAPTGTRDGASFFTLNGIATIDHEKPLYFAASIFWRAAVTDWETPLVTIQESRSGPQLSRVFGNLYWASGHSRPLYRFLQSSLLPIIPRI